MNERIATQGRLADAKLKSAGLTVTQGGEPTFVPHDTHAPEWNAAALGPEKLAYAWRLARRLAHTRFKGGVILQSFGKQYPGEPLPRWQVGVYRSRHGEALWTNVSRLRLDASPLKPAGPESAPGLVRHLAAALGLKDTALPAYEDFESALRRSGSNAAQRLLPRFSRRKRAFVSPPLSAGAARRWGQYLKPAGWVLPLDHDGRRWRTKRLNLAGGEDLTLLPGDSPIGLRLPLHRLPRTAPRRYLTAEIKAGELVVFLPPLETFSAFAHLCRVLEQAAAQMNLPPFRLEGYPPPEDKDLEWIGLTSDPGVLEVNLPPSSNWQDFEGLVRGLYTCADAAELRGFKYQMSGRKVGTGGGAHILLGGTDREHNPFVQCPHIVSSFLRFLQNHPSLSYVFSGLFTGPSCQAPRVDESARDLPYELEITLQALETMPQPGDPAMIDALLRNLLMDWNGNTHRAELSVDKFFNRCAPNGSMGVIEFRAFEMFPTPDGLLAANALVRALAACFSEKSYTHPLIAWGDALQDRFALPWFLAQDLDAVLAYINAQGFDFRREWFGAQWDFRFPVINQFSAGGVDWTLRQAIEPWPVMGEHQGTGRVVDATTDRLELLAEGMGGRSHLAVAVNGLQMPLTRVARNTAVGAVRYRAFDNTWGLQPHIRAQSPLRFQIIDRKLNRVIHAVDYLNWKPGTGRYKGLPSTTRDARKRVAARVVTPRKPHGDPPALRRANNPSQARVTLDLRRC